MTVALWIFLVFLLVCVACEAVRYFRRDRRIGRLEAKRRKAAEDLDKRLTGRRRYSA